MATHSIDGYSSAISIQLEINGQQFPIAQIGPDTLILRTPTDIPPSTTGVLTINVDGRTESEQIVLPNGANKDTVLTKYF